MSSRCQISPNNNSSRCNLDCKEGGGVILLDMARYGAQKGPMCLTCVPVTLCRKTFVGVGVGDINCRYITLNIPHVFICKLHITHIGNIETEHLDNKNIKTE